MMNLNDITSVTENCTMNIKCIVAFFLHRKVFFFPFLHMAQCPHFDPFLFFAFNASSCRLSAAHEMHFFSSVSPVFFFFSGADPLPALSRASFFCAATDNRDSDATPLSQPSGGRAASTARSPSASPTWRPGRRSWRCVRARPPLGGGRQGGHKVASAV